MSFHIFIKEGGQIGGQVGGQVINLTKSHTWSEESFFIENIELEDARLASMQFGQLAFVYGDRNKGNQLLFT